MHGNERKRRGEGKDLGGTEIRSRFERIEHGSQAAKAQERIMAAGKDPNFRNRPEIAAMRKRAETYKAKPPKAESFEAFAKRLKRR